MIDVSYGESVFLICCSDSCSGWWEGDTCSKCSRLGSHGSENLETINIALVQQGGKVDLSVLSYSSQDNKRSSSFHPQMKDYAHTTTKVKEKFNKAKCKLSKEL